VPGTRFQSLVMAAVLLGAAACTPGGGGSDLEAVERLNADPGTLARFTFPYYTSILARPGGGAIAVWMRLEAPFRPMVYRRALDATSAFGEEQYLGTDTVRKTISVVPSVLPGPAEGRLYATWQARVPTSGDKSVVFRRSDDNGETWSEQHTVNSEPTAFIPSMAADPDGAIYLAWTDERDHRRRIFFNRSLDGGETWLDHDVDLEKGDSENGRAVGLDLASDGKGRVVVVWERQRGGRRVQGIVSDDRGDTWGPIARVDDAVRGRYSPTAPKVEFAGERAVVVWTAAATNSMSRIWSDSLGDTDAGWGDDVLVSEVKKGVPANVDLTSRDDTAHLVFSAGPYGADWHVYHTRTDAEGQWAATGAEARQVSQGTGHFTNPRLSVDANQHLAITFVKDQKQIYLNDSTDGGETWGEARLLDEVSMEEKGVTVRYPQVSMADGVAYVIWEKWGARDEVFKTFADMDSKVVPSDLFVRRAVLTR